MTLSIHSMQDIHCARAGSVAFVGVAGLALIQLVVNLVPRPLPGFQYFVRKAGG